ncbi:MAG: pre-16S rRNA-processing nuclease YqgF [Selenomonadales bacterium]|nr:pre-16S rRNA-processing nuclease YqgF [Selenomonadales bacterium]
MKKIIAIDPGRDKCGVAVLSESGSFTQEVIDTADLERWAKDAHRAHPEAAVIIGNGTGSQSAHARIQKACGIEPLFVEEYKTTEEARRRYWQENPPAGWRRLMPTSMQVPPVPVDGYVAVILAERYQQSLRRK